MRGSFVPGKRAGRGEPWRGIRPAARDLGCGDTRFYLEVGVRRVHCRSCGTVKREHLISSEYFTFFL